MRHRLKGNRTLITAQVFELSHTSLAKDLEIKRKTYAAADIQEYWIVNLQHHLIGLRDPILSNPESGDYQTEQPLTDGEVRPITIRDITVSVKQLLEG